MSERICATYDIETPLPVAEAAAMLASEQSSGTFVAIPGETQELREHCAARVEAICEGESVAVPSLPGARQADGHQRARIVVSWPQENVGTNLPALVSTVQGNLYELTQFSGLKLVDLSLPAAFCRAFAGPTFGISGWLPLFSAHG